MSVPTGLHGSTVNQDFDAGCERAGLRSGRGSGAAAPCGPRRRVDVRIGDCSATSVPSAGSHDLREPAPVLLRTGGRGRPCGLGASDRRRSRVRTHVVVLEAVVDCQAAGARPKHGTADVPVIRPGHNQGHPGSESGSCRIVGRCRRCDDNQTMRKRSRQWPPCCHPGLPDVGHDADSSHPKRVGGASTRHERGLAGWHCLVALCILGIYGAYRV